MLFGQEDIKMSKIRSKNQQRGISPIVATVMIVAVTLVAGVAIGGYIFGLFGSQTATAQVTVTVSSINSNSTATGNSLSMRCSSTKVGVGQLSFSNNGAVNATITTVSITYGAQSFSNTTNNNDFTLGSVTGAARRCDVVLAGGTSNIYIMRIPKAASTGNTYVGEVILSDGTRIPFTGTFK